MASLCGPVGAERIVSVTSNATEQYTLWESSEIFEIIISVEIAKKLDEKLSETRRQLTVVFWKVVNQM
jgi:hypothetical protein